MDDLEKMKASHEEAQKKGAELQKKRRRSLVMNMIAAVMCLGSGIIQDIFVLRLMLAIVCALNIFCCVDTIKKMRKLDILLRIDNELYCRFVEDENSCSER